MMNIEMLTFASQRNAKTGHSNKERTGRRDGTGKQAKSGETRQRTNQRDRRGGRREMQQAVREHNAQQPEFSALA